MEGLIKVGLKLLLLMGFMLVFLFGCVVIKALLPPGTDVVVILLWLIVLAKIFKSVDK